MLLSHIQKYVLDLRIKTVLQIPNPFLYQVIRRPGVFSSANSCPAISMLWIINGSIFVIKTSQMTWFWDVFTTIKQYFFFVDQIMLPEFVLLLYIYIMHAQSCLVYKWMTVLILVIKDIKVEQLNVFTGYILFEEFFQ